MRTVVRRVSTVRLASVGPLAAVGVSGLGAVVLVAGLALLALEARAGLGADSDAVAQLDVLDLLADADGLADDLVADAAWVAGRWLTVALVVGVHLHELSWAPAAGQHVEIRLSDERFSK